MQAQICWRAGSARTPAPERDQVMEIERLGLRGEGTDAESRPPPVGRQFVSRSEAGTGSV
jgi:hypothetical protein